jgi:hypothetical protein
LDRIGLREGRRCDKNECVIAASAAVLHSDEYAVGRDASNPAFVMSSGIAP